MAGAAAVTAVTPVAPGAFSFLKHGVVLPARRCGLFTLVFAIDVVLSLALSLFKYLVVAPHAAAAETSRPEDPAAVLSTHFLLLRAGAAYLALYLAAAAVTKVAAASAAVASYSGERHTPGTFLRRVGRDLANGGAVAVALGWALRAAGAAAAAGSVAAMPLILIYDASPRLLLLDALLGTLAFQLYFYLGAVCAVAVVTSAAEPGRRGHRAVARAWRPFRGTGASALLYLAATWALSEAAGRVRPVAVGWMLPQGAGREEKDLVDAAVRYLLDHVVKVFSVAAVTGYYFDCRKIEDKEEDKAGHGD